MEKIRVLFIQEKKIKKGKMITLGDLIENEVPDTYQVDYVSAKENILDKAKKFEPKIIFIAQSTAYDIFRLIKELREIDPEVVVLVNLTTAVETEQKMIDELKALGAYKCYSSVLSVDSLVHDMFVALNME